MNEPKVITIEGKEYLGNIVGNTIQNSLRANGGPSMRDGLTAWVTGMILGELTDIELSAGAEYTSVDLDPEAVEIFTILMSKLERAEKIKEKVILTAAFQHVCSK